MSRKEKMLQRAASNAYSWWWASHIKIKQSRWLDDNQQDMEQNVKTVLRLIEEDADSFAKKAEMYYRRRPELVKYIQEVYNNYRALVERYDRVSGELQKANKIISTVFPNQVHYGSEGEDGGDYSPKATTIDFNTLQQSILLSSSSEKTDNIRKNLSEEKAGKEIERLQKAILVLQTEKEFIKTSYLNGIARYWDIEKTVTEMQEEICGLQGETDNETIIEDDEARNLMAVTALRSCEDALRCLQEQHNKYTAEATIESRRITQLEEKLRVLKLGLGRDSVEINELRRAQNSTEEARVELKSMHDMAAEGNFGVLLDMSMLELALNIDELVTKVIRLETTASSPAAQIHSLTADIDELNKNLEGLEGQDASQVDDPYIVSDSLRQAEKELRRIRDFDRCIQDERCEFQSNFNEACDVFNYLSDQLQSSKQAEDVEPLQENYEEPHEENIGFHSNGIDVVVTDDNECDRTSSRAEESEHEKIDSDAPDWEKMFKEGLEDRQKVLLSEYTSILRNYKEAKRRLAEEETKNRDSHIETMDKIRQFKSVIELRDEQIKSLKQELKFLDNKSWNEIETISDKPETENINGNEEKTAEDLNVEKEENHESQLNGGCEQQEQKTDVEEKFRRDIDNQLEENLEFWMRFTSSEEDVNRYQVIIQDLQLKLKEYEDNKTSVNKSNAVELEGYIRRQLKDLETEMLTCVEKNAALKKELQGRFSSLCCIKEEILKASKQWIAGEEEPLLSANQTARFQGEVLTMVQENNKVADGLGAGLDRVRGLQEEAERMLGILKGDVKESGRSKARRRRKSKHKLPMKSFLFGGKQLKLPCMKPAIQKLSSGVGADVPPQLL